MGGIHLVDERPCDVADMALGYIGKLAEGMG